LARRCLASCYEGRLWFALLLFAFMTVSAAHVLAYLFQSVDLI
jgi:hypothetical protein